MKTRAGSRSSIGRTVILIGIFRLSSPCPAQDTTTSFGINYDCATLSLYQLLSLEGYRPGLKRLEANFPPPRPSGFTLLEIRKAALASGMRLMGVRFGNRDAAPDRPMLVFLNRGPHGHFAVARPVGHTGKLVQLVDSLRPPEVLDAIDLYARDEWTGLALIPERPDWAFRMGVGSILALLFFLVARRVSRMSATGHGRRHAWLTVQGEDSIGPAIPTIEENS